MYKFLIFVVPLLFFSCKQEKADKPDDLLFHYMVNNYRGQRISSDTITIGKILRHQEKDDLLKEFTFTTQNKEHLIRLFSNSKHASIDGGEFIFELDTLGVIYSCSDCWTSSMRLKSNNDSLNELIDIALEHCLMYSTHMIDQEIIGVRQEKTIQFLPPNN